jgi:hypothetical protein
MNLLLKSVMRVFWAIKFMEVSGKAEAGPGVSLLNILPGR